MYVLITYDVETLSPKGQKRLRLVAKCCKNYGQRVQNSVFECELQESTLVQLRAELSSIIDDETDSIRIYHLGKNYQHKIELIGKQTSFDINGALLI